MTSVSYDRVGGVATVTLNGTEKLNALDAAAYRALRDAVARFVRDEAARCLVLTGAGRAFCAGQDLDELPQLQQRSSSQVKAGLEVIQATTRLLLDTAKPTLAAINGPAVGAGAEISLAFDLRLGREGCYFMFPELQYGLFQTNASTCLLPLLVGHGRASELMLLGERLDDRAALACGLLNSLHDPASFESAVQATSERLAGLSPRATGLLKRTLRANPGAGVEASLKREIEDSMKLVPGTAD